MNAIQQAHQNILACGTPTAKVWLADYLEKRRLAKEVESAVQAATVSPPEVVTYECDRGHRFTRPGKLASVGNCPQCREVNIKFRTIDPGKELIDRVKQPGEPSPKGPVVADFDHDPELQDEPWERG